MRRAKRKRGQSDLCPQHLSLLDIGSCGDPVGASQGPTRRDGTATESDRDRLRRDCATGLRGSGQLRGEARQRIKEVRELRSLRRSDQRPG